MTRPGVSVATNVKIRSLRSSHRVVPRAGSMPVPAGLHKPAIMTTQLIALVLVLLAWRPAAEAVAQSELSLSVLPLHTLEAFADPAPNWKLASEAISDRHLRRALTVAPGTGILVNKPADGSGKNLFTIWEHGDLELRMEFLMPRGSNSGIYLQGRYEVQLLDSWHSERPTFGDVGGLYERWDEAAGRGYEGRAPRHNAARAPGLWQKLHIMFQAPRFDGAGRKVRDARFVRVALNGLLLHENIDISGPTRASAFDDEQPAGPLMIQGDHGPVAFRNIRYKRLGSDVVEARDIAFAVFEDSFESVPEILPEAPALSGRIRSLAEHNVKTRDPVLVAYEGELHIPTEGSYHFALTLDWITGDPHFQDARIGGARLQIGDAQVLFHDSNYPEAEGLANLGAGPHPFSLVYFKNVGWRAPSISLSVEGPDTPRRVLKASLPGREPHSPILVEPEGESRLLRSFVFHDGKKRTHALSVGDPGGVHYSLDLETAALLFVWRGAFVDATPMWHNRGRDQVIVPMGNLLQLDGAPSFALLRDEKAPWPESSAARVAFADYRLDAAGRPTIRYRLGGITIKDHLAPAGDGPYLRRTIRAAADKAAQSVLWVRAAAAESITRLDERTYSVGPGRYFIETGGGSDARLRQGAGGHEILLALPLGTGEASVTYSIIW